MKKIISYIILFLGVASLSTSAIFVKLADAPAAIVAFYRLLFALILLFPLLIFSKERRTELIRMPAKNRMLSVLAGVLLAIHYILWFESLNYTSVSSSTVLVALQPVFNILLGFFFLQERQNKIAVFGCLLTLIGSCSIGWGDFQGGAQAIWGDLMALCSAIFISLYFFIGQQIRRDTSATVYSILGYSGSVIFLAIYALILHQPFFGYSVTTWECFIGLTLLPTILGQFTFNTLLKWMPATSISMGILGEPVGTCILAYILFHETIGVQQGFGMIAILAGLGIYFFSVPIQKKLHTLHRV